MRVLGIDPGTGRCGFGVVEKHGTTITPVNYGVIETYKDQSDLERLNIVYEGVAELIATYRPAFMGVETLYFNTNITTGIKVAQARGVILLAGYRQNVPIIPVTPLQVKQQLTGYGRADKKQVIEMVKRMMHITKKIDPDDAADALAGRVQTRNHRAVHIQHLTVGVGAHAAQRHHDKRLERDGVVMLALDLVDRGAVGGIVLNRVLGVLAAELVGLAGFDVLVVALHGRLEVCRRDAQLFGQLGVGQNALKIGEFPQSCQQAPLRAALYGAAAAVRYNGFSSRPINRPEAAPYRPRRPTAAPAHGVSRRLFSTGSRRSARRTKQCGRS